MQTQQEVLEMARQIAKKHKTDTLFVNDKGEFFLQENLAKLSVAGDTNRIKKLTFKSPSEGAVQVESAIQEFEVDHISDEEYNEREEKNHQEKAIEIADPAGVYDALDLTALKAEADKRGISYTKNAGKDKMIMLLDADDLAKKNAAANPEMIDHIVTEEDLKNNPDLAANGVKVGDTIQVPKTA